MKVIDVLNMWANGEDVNAIDEKGYFAGTRKLLDNLNSEIELEDTPEDKKIDKILTWFSIDKDDNENIVREAININFQNIAEKLDEIIDRLNGE